MGRSLVLALKGKIIVFTRLFLVLMLLSSCSSTFHSGALIQVNKYYSRGEYDKALEKIAFAQSYYDLSPKVSAEVTFLKASIFDKQGRTGEAVGVYKYISDNYPDSQYGYASKERVKVINKDFCNCK